MVGRPTETLDLAMAIDRSTRTRFQNANVARLYNEVRPGYPQQLIEDTLILSEMSPDGRILEVGCGSGQATIPFTEKGYAMLCLELAADLAQLAAENCRPYPDVQIQNVSFEDWPLQEKSFDLFISAQAFHWVPPEIGYPKAAAALKDTGSIALFWNLHPDPDTAFLRALNAIFQSTVGLANPAGSMSREESDKINVGLIESSGLFDKVVVKHYPWSERYTTEQYIKLLHTYFGHQVLPEKEQQELFTRVGELVERFGGVVDRPYLAALYWARVRRQSGKHWRGAG